jgi:nitroreductase
VSQILEAGRLSASAMNKQPWHFVLVQERSTLQQIGGLAKSGPYVAQASFAVVVCVEKTPFGVSDGSRAVQNMVLAGIANGVYSNWVGFVGRFDDLKPVLGIPDDLDILAVLPFGYPADTGAKGPKQRKPLAEVASRERYGQPLS